MRTVPSYLYTKEILKQIDDLILDDGYNSYAAVRDIEKDLLAVKAMRATDRMDLFCVITDCDDADSTLSSFMKYLCRGGSLEAYELAETMRRNALSYFEESFTALFEERHDLLECERKYEAGLRPVTDRINGEVRWVR